VCNKKNNERSEKIGLVFISPSDSEFILYCHLFLIVPAVYPMAFLFILSVPIYFSHNLKGVSQVFLSTELRYVSGNGVCAARHTKEGSCWIVEISQQGAFTSFILSKRRYSGIAVFL